ncbi:peptidylprolyl isomerase [Heyndrickxia acidicola]|uniref:Foldase protein PrsA n=1 Tax=Heyndrickxia acidicola TaxID=209389 RepID=A0ABU6MD35_9BACI|nr:peptidylprolyl isomerase [Heyndrickxia acidicola]MED1202430.1 peptidylprolyl isomerase [Heyndrickxia acidicola]
MKKWVLSLSLAASMIGLAACGNSAADNSAVVKTSAGNITKDELYTAMKDKYGQQVLQQLVYEKVLSKKYSVSKSEIDKQVNQAKQQLGDQFDQALAQYGYKDENDFRNSIKLSLLQEKAATQNIKVTDKELKDYYNNIKPEIRASHILVSDEKTAESIKAQLDKGADFATLAKKYSQDTGSKNQGGDVGWFGTGKMDPAFEAAAYKLKVGQISNPVKSQYGWHIIKLTGEKTKEPFNKMKDEITQEVKDSKVTQTDIQNAMKNELKDAGVKIEDKDLKSTFDSLSQPAPTSTPGSGQ